jgi:hypothetical protein
VPALACRCGKSTVVQRMQILHQAIDLTKRKPVATVEVVHRREHPRRLVNRKPVSLREFVRANRAVL